MLYTTVAVDGKITLKCDLFYNTMICTTHLRRILPMVEFISLFGWYLDGIVDFFGVGESGASWRVGYVGTLQFSLTA